MRFYPTTAGRIAAPTIPIKPAAHQKIAIAKICVINRKSVAIGAATTIQTIQIAMEIPLMAARLVMTLRANRR
jgi:hypothetical protein